MFKRIIDIKKDIAVIDIGTSTVCTAIAKGEHKSSRYFSLGSENNIRVLGVGYQMSKGIKFGAITNIEDLEDALLRSISTAEQEAQKSIKFVIIALPPWAIESQIVENFINIGQVPVDEVHINSLIDFDTRKYLDKDVEPIHIFPIFYSIDDSDGIQDPIGMVGNKLSATFHVMAVKSSLLKNIRNCLNQSNITIVDFVCSSYCSLLSVALDEELSSGVTLIDIGGSCTSISCIKDGILVYMGVLPVGGDSITNDIATVLHTNKVNAERLKILYGVSEIDMPSTHEEEQILVSTIDEFGEEHIQGIPKSYLDYIISSRIDDVFDLIKKHFEENISDPSYYKQIVITGGGSQISGFSEYIKSKNIFIGSNIRLGKPIGTIGSHDFVKTAAFSSTAGTVLYGLGNFPGRKSLKPIENKTFAQRIKTWFKRGI